VLHPSPYDVLAVQLSAFQLRWSTSLRPQSAVCLNISGTDQDDGTLAVRGRVYQNAERACVFNDADPATEALVMDAEVIEGCRAIGFGLGVPAVSMIGLVEDVLCDRAFVAQRATSAAELGTLDDVRTAGAGILAVHNITNALAAAALARGFGVTPIAVRDGLRNYLPLPHHLMPAGLTEAKQIEDADRPGADSGPEAGSSAGGPGADAGLAVPAWTASGAVSWVDDSAATDAAAAAAGLSAFERVVWIAGGSLDPEGDPASAVAAQGRERRIADLDRVAQTHAGRLRAVVLIGPDRGVLREALQRHAPDVPVVEVDGAETGAVPVMEVVVARAGQLARAGDTVLLSPGFGPAPFPTLAQRGHAFTAAVRDRTDAAGTG
jgi:UDP-N-acetylmuramoylalanine--D-glutamate ligase